jgi:hypothetical protein
MKGEANAKILEDDLVMDAAKEAAMAKGIKAGDVVEGAAGEDAAEAGEKDFWLQEQEE